MKLSYNNWIYYYRKQTVIYHSQLSTVTLFCKHTDRLINLIFFYASCSICMLDFSISINQEKNIFVVTNAIKFFILALVIQEFCIFGFQVTKSCIRHNQRYSQSTNGNPTWNKNHDRSRPIHSIVFQSTKSHKSVTTNLEFSCPLDTANRF